MHSFLLTMRFFIKAEGVRPRSTAPGPGPSFSEQEVCTVQPMLITSQPPIFCHLMSSPVSDIEATPIWKQDPSPLDRGAITWRMHPQVCMEHCMIEGSRIGRDAVIAKIDHTHGPWKPGMPSACCMPSSHWGSGPAAQNRDFKPHAESSPLAVVLGFRRWFEPRLTPCTPARPQMGIDSAWLGFDGLTNVFRLRPARVVRLPERAFREPNDGLSSSTWKARPLLLAQLPQPLHTA